MSVLSGFVPTPIPFSNPFTFYSMQSFKGNTKNNKLSTPNRNGFPKSSAFVAHGMNARISSRFRAPWTEAAVVHKPSETPSWQIDAIPLSRKLDEQCKRQAGIAPQPSQS
jgi:hypothetical protein